ncbi:DNA damage-binding protein 1, partial [Geodia barretti]
LRLVRSGVGINEQASIDLAGVKGVWSLRCGTEMAESDNTLVLAFVGQTTWELTLPLSLPLASSFPPIYICIVHPLAFLWLIPLPPLSLSLSSSFLPILPLSSSLLCLSFFLPPFNRSFRSKELYCHTFSLSLLSLHFFHPFLCTSSVLSLKGEEVEETELEGIAADQQTHYCSNVIGNKILQITGQSVRLINEETLQLVSKWAPPSGKGISTGSCGGSHVVVVVGNELFCLDIQDSSLHQLSHVTLEHEIACVDVRVLKGDSGTSNICAVGLWTNISARVLRLPSLDTLHTQPLGGDILPRSILVAEFDTRTYLLVALGDGTLHYFQMDPDSGMYP